MKNSAKKERELTNFFSFSESKNCCLDNIPKDVCGSPDSQFNDFGKELNVLVGQEGRRKKRR